MTKPQPRIAADLNAAILRDLSEYSARHDGTVPFAASVVRFGPREGEVSLMNRQEGGWAQRSYTYATVWALAREWRLVFLEFGKDEHSRFIRVAPLRDEVSQ